MQAPATLMLVAHVEQEGVWTVTGGMHHLAVAIATLARRHGADIRTGETVTHIETTSGRATALILASGDRHPADAIIANTDAAALTAGLFGQAAAQAVRTDPTRSLSALTWSIAAAPTGFALAHHTVIFSDDYAAEFAELGQGILPSRPTVYICAADRTDAGPALQTPERLFCIINAPANGDRHATTPQEVQACQTAMTRLFQTVGLHLNPQSMTATTPTDFARLFPATGGALYGPATHGPFASFRRPASRTSLPGLYLAGGSVHPGPGVPMAALSGRLAAASVLQDFASTSQFRKTAIAGGTSTR
jgi:1-hydroxycarotenoid 3,4-desaturase